MIRIDVGRDELKRKIAEHEPGWLEDAQERTDELEEDPSRKITSTWSPIKQVYTDLQHSKCAFCEKEIEDQPIEQDVEHFRPKNNVRRWSVPDWLVDDEGVRVRQPDSGSEPGYRLLAYHYLNYAAACKTCNSTRKRDYFPIAAATRKSGSKNPARMKTEKAYLIYPVSDVDEDPEQLIEFYGVLPRAKQSSGFGRKRALVTIEIFQLDNEGTRQYLFKRRAEKIWLLYHCLRQLEQGTAAERADALRVADHLTSPESEHTNCLRCFRKLYESDAAEAETIARQALALWATGSA